MSRAATLVGFTAAVLVVSRALASCIIADPPAEPPQPLTEQPYIVNRSIVPTPPLLTEWPTGGFIVPVHVSTTFQYAFYVDSLSTALGKSPILEAPSDAGYLATGSPSAPDAGGCHIVSFGVQNYDPNDPPSSPGVLAGDVAALWLYYPTGQGGCTGFDASAFQDGAFPPVMDGFSPPPVMVDGSE
jgi:hypothetical protein